MLHSHVVKIQKRTVFEIEIPGTFCGAYVGLLAYLMSGLVTGARRPEHDT